MKHYAIVCRELSHAGLPTSSFKAAEIRHLPKLLKESETIEAALRGLYDGGVGMLIATSQRLLVINKGPLWLRVDDEPFAMLSGVEHKYGILLSKLMITTRSRNYDFTLLKRQPLDRFVNYVEGMMRGDSKELTPHELGSLHAR